MLELFFIFSRYRFLVDPGTSGRSLGIEKRSLECSNDYSQPLEDLQPPTAVITTVGHLSGRKYDPKLDFLTTPGCHVVITAADGAAGGVDGLVVVECSR